MRLTRLSALAVVFVLASGCYHATINTGRQPNGQTINVPWAHSFIGGLVPPKVVETASTCPNGVAVVETQHSFLNMLAQIVTFSIYSPMTITVQCAGGDVPEDGATIQAAAGEMDAAVREAVLLSHRTGAAVYLELQ